MASMFCIVDNGPSLHSRKIVFSLVTLPPLEKPTPVYAVFLKYHFYCFCGGENKAEDVFVLTVVWFSSDQS